MADHFLETPEYEQSKNLGLVYLKEAKSVKIKTSKYISFAGWFVTARPATFTPPLTKIPGSAPVYIAFYIPFGKTKE